MRSQGLEGLVAWLSYGVVNDIVPGAVTRVSLRGILAAGRAPGQAIPAVCSVVGPEPSNIWAQIPPETWVSRSRSIYTAPL